MDFIELAKLGTDKKLGNQQMFWGEWKTKPYEMIVTYFIRQRRYNNKLEADTSWLFVYASCAVFFWFAPFQKNLTNYMNSNKSSVACPEWQGKIQSKIAYER